MSDEHKEQRKQAQFLIDYIPPSVASCHLKEYADLAYVYITPSGETKIEYAYDTGYVTIAIKRREGADTAIIAVLKQGGEVEDGKFVRYWEFERGATDDKIGDLIEEAGFNPAPFRKFWGG